MQRRKLYSAIAALTLMVGAAGTSSAISQQYKITELAPLAGCSSSYAAAINNSNVVTGTANNMGPMSESYPVVWRNGTAEALPAPDTFSIARAINDNGVVVGDGACSACKWDGNTYVDLGSMVGGIMSYATGINSSGQIVGNVTSADTFNDQAFRITGNTVEYFPSASPDEVSYVKAINDLGQAVGSVHTGNTGHAILWGADGVKDLGTLGGNRSLAYDINNQGWVVGESDCQVPGFGEGTGAFVWNGSVMTKLAGIWGGFDKAWAINNKNQIVGSSAWTACIWEGDTLTDLNSLLSPDSGWVLNEAVDINDNGVIIGYGKYMGEDRAFMLTPTPEPSSLAALFLGAAGAFSGVVRKRKASRA